MIALEVGKSYLVPWRDKVSVGEYIVTSIENDKCHFFWKNGVENSFHLGCGIHEMSVEFDSSKLDTLSCDDSWLDKKIDDTFFIEGLLNKTIRHDAIEFALIDKAFNTLSISLMYPLRNPYPEYKGPIRIRVIRTEDGLETHQGWIDKAISDLIKTN